MKIIESKGGKVTLETEESATLLNLLVERLWEDKLVKRAAYGAKHPFLSKFELLVEGRDNKKAIEKACDSIIKDCDALLKQI
ncbi:MAG: RpoL/Rpb11 RNA polymerase subunit family protein [Candidatus Aenigmatarchaeota archaeon]